MNHVQPGSSNRLEELGDFGSNPGNLRAFRFVPQKLPIAVPLVVVLHGCGQTAERYDHCTGWSMLAERHGFALLFPEQRAENNPNRCFNWFLSNDISRGEGEALSVRQMVAAMVQRHAIDTTSIFVTGLSAGGAMTSVMLATYPDVFAGGATIAGLPYGSALGISQALQRMRGSGGPDAASLRQLVRNASNHKGPWPRISIWHGSDDTTVAPSNAGDIAAQWRSLHAVADAPDLETLVDGYPRRAWLGRDGREVIEEYRIIGMSHGTPLDTRGEAGLGAIAPYMLDVGISSTRHIAAFWGIVDRSSASEYDLPHAAPVEADTQATDERWPGMSRETAGVADVIEKALRAAGLMQ